MTTTTISAAFGPVFRKQSIFLIGDSIVDEHVFGHIGAKTDNTHGPTHIQYSTTVTQGGAGLVHANLLALGANVNPPVYEHYRQVTRKRRFVVEEGGVKKTVFQSDFSPPPVVLPGNLEWFRERIKLADKVVVADYRHGLLTEDLISEIVLACEALEKPLYVASQISQQPSNHHLYASPNTVFVLNERECHALQGNKERANPHAVSNRIRNRAVVVTRGAKATGMYMKGKNYLDNPPTTEVIDPTGAGDAFLACFCLMPLDNPTLALHVANIWAALSTETFGTTPPVDTEQFWNWGLREVAPCP